MVAEAKPSKSICLNWLHVHISNVNCLAREAKGEFVLVHASVPHAYLLIVCIVCNFTSVYNMKGYRGGYIHPPSHLPYMHELHSVKETSDTSILNLITGS